MSNLTITEKRIVGRYVRETYESRTPVMSVLATTARSAS